MQNAEEKVISNHILLVSILDNLTSQQLLPHRLVCKLWRDEANRLIRVRQRRFFLSPCTTTKSTMGYNDQKWVRGWENALQICFIYSPWRRTFIRASRRLIETTHTSIHLEAKTTETIMLNKEQQRIESAFYQETEDLFHGRPPNPSSPCFNSKMAGYTLSQLSDFLESLPKTQDDSNVEHEIGHSNFAHLCFRFECGRLRDCPEISRFFKVMGPHIRYLTLNTHHMCRGDDPSDTEREDPRVYTDNQWDHSYALFRQVPNLMVLTLILRNRWMRNICGDFAIIDLQRNQPRVENFSQNQDKMEPFLHLKCIRIQETAQHPNSRHYVHWIMCRARRVERVVFEMGFSPSILPFLGEVDWNSNPKAWTFPTPVRLIMPIKTLFLQVFEQSPKVTEYIAQLVIKQGEQQQHERVTALHLYLTSRFPLDVACFGGGGDWVGGSPFNSPGVPPLLKILKIVAPSLETMSLIGGAGIFLQNLINNNYYLDPEESRLKSFPKVGTLFFCLAGVTNLDRRDFCSSPVGNNHDPNLTSTSTLPQVFPRVHELSLDIDGYSIDLDGRMGSGSWISFMSSPDLFFNQGQDRGQGSNRVTEVKSVRKLRVGPTFSLRALELWNFSQLETLCLTHHNFLGVASTIWRSLGGSGARFSLQTVMVDRLIVDGRAECGLGPQVEGALSGLSPEVIVLWAEDLESRLPTKTTQEDRDNFLRNKRADFLSLVTATGPSIFDFKGLKHLKLLFTIARVDEMIQKKFSNPIFSVVGGLIVFDLLPPSCYVTLWAESNRGAKEPPISHGVLQKAFGSSVSSHPRVDIRGIRTQYVAPCPPY